MTKQTQDNGNGSNASYYFFMGLLIGGLAGTAATLLMAPQSGKDTRDQIQAKGIELRVGAAESVEKSVGQVRQMGEQLSADVRQKASELQQRGQDLIDEQREHLSTLMPGNNGVNISS